LQPVQFGQRLVPGGRAEGFLQFPCHVRVGLHKLLQPRQRDDVGRQKIWDLEAAKETLTLLGHTDDVTSLVLSADGKRLFSGSLDKTIKVWDLDAGAEAP
jgi:hypothetical protein